MRDRTLTERARQMRHEPTSAEQRLWLALRARRFAAVKFRRQKVIGRYIADFAANEPKLVVEIDGDTHATRAHYDADRTRYLEGQGYRVLRFTNGDVTGNLEGVLTSIQGVLHRTGSPLPTLSPEGERA